jgi:hypothetical protein
MGSFNTGERECFLDLLNWGGGEIIPFERNEYTSLRGGGGEMREKSWTANQDTN